VQHQCNLTNLVSHKPMQTCTDPCICVNLSFFLFSVCSFQPVLPDLNFSPFLLRLISSRTRSRGLLIINHRWIPTWSCSRRTSWPSQPMGRPTRDHQDPSISAGVLARTGTDGLRP
jgi:hypothetical protein